MHLPLSASHACQCRRSSSAGVGESHSPFATMLVSCCRLGRIDVSTVAAALARCSISSISSTFAALLGLVSVSLASQMSHQRCRSLAAVVDVEDRPAEVALRRSLLALVSQLRTCSPSFSLAALSGSAHLFFSSNLFLILKYKAESTISGAK